MQKKYDIEFSRTKTNKVAIYVRVSKNDQKTLNQLLLLKSYAEQKGWQYVVFDETESTRKTRPVKQELLRRIRAGEFDAILVYKLDRFARSMKELLDNISELLKKEIQFVSLKEQLDFSTAVGKLYFHIVCAFAEFERDLIRERTMDGLTRAKSEGKRLGRPAGSKDKSKRATSGYILRAANKRKSDNELNGGVVKHIETYLK